MVRWFDQTEAGWLAKADLRTLQRFVREREAEVRVVRERRAGRENFYALDRAALEDARAWLAVFWRGLDPDRDPSALPSVVMTSVGHWMRRMFSGFSHTSAQSSFSTLPMTVPLLSTKSL